MKTKKLILLLMTFSLLACQGQTNQNSMSDSTLFPGAISKEELKKNLSPEQYYVIVEKGTERPHTGEFNLHFEEGIYTCAACGSELFDSDSKFDAHCGWPSFDQAKANDKIVEKKDVGHGMIRTEIMCANCGGHLGHVFNDGPTSTGLRYCVNSLSIDFKSEEKEE